MKFCYADESGHGAEYMVIVGVVVDAIRMHRTKEDWNDLIKELYDVTEGRFSELKAGQLYRGNDLWRQWDSGERTELIERIISWMVKRKHEITFAAVSRSRLASQRSAASLDGMQNATEWGIAAMHLILEVQKWSQKEKNNKGNTVFVFDNAQEKDELLKLTHEPPGATGGFYNLKKKQRPLDQLIDVPYFVDSRHVGLIQVADLFAFLLRLYADLADGLMEEKFEGELKRVNSWIAGMRPVLLPDSVRWPKSSKDPCARFFQSIAPPSLLEVAA